MYGSVQFTSQLKPGWCNPAWPARSPLPARAQVCSPKRLHLKLEQGKIQTPELVNDLELPDTLAVLGQSVDLTQVRVFTWVRVLCVCVCTHMRKRHCSPLGTSSNHERHPLPSCAHP